MENRGFSVEVDFGGEETMKGRIRKFWATERNRETLDKLLGLFYFLMVIVGWPVFLRCVLGLIKAFNLFTIGFTLTTGVAAYFITKEAYYRFFKPMMEEGER